MKLLQLDKQKEFEKLPTQLDMLKILDKRQGLKSKDRELYKRLKAGLSGEEIFHQMLKLEGEEDWTVLRNVWLDYYGSCEFDSIIFTGQALYIFEIKNYNGHFKYEDGICTINGNKISHNCVAQAQRAYRNMKNICKENSLHVNIYCVLVFIGENCTVEINSPTDGLIILQRNQLSSFISKIIEEETQLRYNQKINVQKVLGVLNDKAVINPFLRDPISEEELKKLKRGIYCSHCSNFNLDIKKNYVSCPCGMHEPRIEAAIRTICEFGVLNYNCDLTKKELMGFMDNQISSSYFKKIVNIHFTVIKKGRSTYYQNKKLPYHKIKDQFDIPLPAYLVGKNQCVISASEEVLKQTLAKLK